MRAEMSRMNTNFKNLEMRAEDLQRAKQTLTAEVATLNESLTTLTEQSEKEIQLRDDKLTNIKKLLVSTLHLVQHLPGPCTHVTPCVVLAIVFCSVMRFSERTYTCCIPHT